MNPPIAERLQSAVAQARWSEAVALLQTCDAIQAAAALGSLPFEQQQSLFRHLPLDLAAGVVAQFPCYHEYVLLHSLPRGKMRALVDKLNPDDRMRLLDELSSTGADETSGQHEPETVRAPEEQPPHLGESRDCVSRRQVAPQGSPLPHLCPARSPRGSFQSTEHLAQFGRYSRRTRDWPGSGATGRSGGDSGYSSHESDLDQAHRRCALANNCARQDLGSSYRGRVPPVSG